MYPLLLAGCLLLPALAHAATQLPTVLVSAARSDEPGIRTAASTLIITQEEIRDSGARNLTDLLRGRAGIHVTDLYGDGSTTALDMRGFGNNANSNTLVLVNGRRLNPASDSSNLYLNRVDLSQVLQVEVIQGSAGVLFGNQAVGGVINIVTTRPEALEAQAGITLGSYDTVDARVRVEDRVQNGFGYRVSGQRRTSDNYRDRNDATLENLAIEIDYVDGDDRYWMAAERLNEDTETPGALFLEEITEDRRQAAYPDDFIDTDSELLSLGIRQRLSERWRFEGEVFYTDDDRDFVQSFRNSPGSPSTQDRRTWEVTPRLIGRIAGERGDTHITLGADFQYTDYLLQGFGPQAVEQTIAAVYGQVILPVSPDTEVSLGLRYAEVRNDLFFEDFSVFPSTLRDLEIDDEATAAAIGLVHELSTAWEIFARANQNYRFAKVDEHTNNVFGQPVGLDTQTGTSYEIGARVEDGRTRADLIAYRIDLDDEILFDASGFANINVDGTRRIGLLVSAEHDLVTPLTVGISYNYVDSEITAGPFKGEAIPLVPEHKIRLYGRWQASPRAFVQLEGLAVSDQRYGGDYANQFPELDGYEVLNLSAGYASGPWRFNLRVNNLTDEEYSETGNIGFDDVTPHSGCIGFNCPAENPSPEINGWVTAEYLWD